MIYTSARWANPEETEVFGTAANGNTELRKVSEPHAWRRPEEFLTGFLAGGGVVDPYEAPPAPSPFLPLRPYQFWTAVRATDHEADLRGWAAALENPLQKAAATSMLEFSLEYRFDHPYMDAARQALGLPISEFETLWLWAMTL